MEDEGRLSIAQDILRDSTDFLRRIIAPTMEWEVSLCRRTPFFRAICELDVSHCCGSCFLPLTNNELPFHVNDNSSCSHSMFNSIRKLQPSVYCADSSDSRRTPTQRCERASCLRSTRCQVPVAVMQACCDLKSRMIPSTCSCS